MKKVWQNTKVQQNITKTKNTTLNTNKNYNTSKQKIHKSKIKTNGQNKGRKYRPVTINFCLLLSK